MNNHIKRIIKNNPEAEFVIWMKNETECNNVFQTLSELGYDHTIPIKSFKEMWDEMGIESNYKFGVKVKCYAKDCSFNDDLDHWIYYNYDIVEFTNPDDLEELELMENKEIPLEKREKLDEQQKDLNKRGQELIEYIKSVNEEAQEILEDVEEEDNKINPGDWVTTKTYKSIDELDPRDVFLVAAVTENGIVSLVYEFEFGFNRDCGCFPRFVPYQPEKARKISIEDVLKILNKNVKK